VATLNPVTRLLENTRVYRLWQAPFAEKKWAPIVRHNDLARVQRVLDVGCGPGTNTRYFLDKEYLGIDINPRYTADAGARFGKEFVTADVTTWQSAGKTYDFILLNSFLHHIDDQGCRRILANLQTHLEPSGFIHILDLVLPERVSAARVLARADRGGFARPLAPWHELFSEFFEPTLFEPYSLSVAGIDLWKMVYFRGRLRDA
jgi:trans-aconitate methyltransferase